MDPQLFKQKRADNPKIVNQRSITTLDSGMSRAADELDFTMTAQDGSAPPQQQQQQQQQVQTPVTAVVSSCRKLGLRCNITAAAAAAANNLSNADDASVGEPSSSSCEWVEVTPMDASSWRNKPDIADIAAPAAGQAARHLPDRRRKKKPAAAAAVDGSVAARCDQGVKRLRRSCGPSVAARPDSVGGRGGQGGPAGPGTAAAAVSAGGVGGGVAGAAAAAALIPGPGPAAAGQSTPSSQGLITATSVSRCGTIAHHI